MLKVIYSKEGNPISDFKVCNFVDYVMEAYAKHKPDVTLIKISSELCFLTFGLRVLEDKIPIDEIEFYFENEKLNFHPYLGIEGSKYKKLSFYNEICDKIAKLGSDKMLKDKKNEVCNV